MKSFIRMITAVLLVALLAGCAGKPHTQTEAATEGAQLAPDFTVYDADGNPVRLSDYRGKPVVLNFWASWCGPCKSEMPEFNAAYEAQGEQIVFMMVNLTDGVSETVQSAQAYVDGQGYSLPVYFDTAGEAAGTYGIRAIPATYFINAEGSLVNQAVGMIDGDTLQQNINLIR